MNMRAQLTEEQMLAQRAMRTGRRAPEGTPGAPTRESVDPGAARPAVPARSPFLDMLPPDDDSGAPSDDGAQPTGGAVPQPSEVAQMQQQLQAALGRVAPLQQTVEQLRASVESLTQANAQLQAQAQAAAQAQSAAQARQAAEQFDPFASLPADDIALIDPAVVKAMRLAAQSALAQATANVQDPKAIVAQALQERDERARQSYIRNKANELNLVALGNDPRFQEFLAADDSAEILLNSFVKAADLEAARYLEPRVRAMLKRFEKSTAQPGGGKPADAPSNLAAHLARPGAKNPSAKDGPRKELTPERAKQIREQAARLQRQRRFTEAAELLAQLN